MDYTIERMAQNELELGEKLLWTGQPNPKRPALQTLPISLFAIPWTAFAVFWVVGAASIGAHASNAPGVFQFFPLFGVPFILIGLGMLTAPVWAYQKALRTVYAITDKRLLIIVNGRSRTVQSYDEHNIGDIQRREFADGSGDVVFARQVRYGTNNNAGTTSSAANIGFFGVRDVRSVEKLVRDIARKD